MGEAGIPGRRRMENGLELDATLEKVRKQVESYLNDTQIARQLSERDRDYVDHRQWTPEQVAALAARKQSAIVVNRIKPKVDGLVGLVASRKGDVRAYPRTKKHERSAEAITDALRYVCDRNDFNDAARLQVAEDFFVEGYGGVIVDVETKPSGENEIRIEVIPWDRIYFDPYSRKHDFSDSRFTGMIVWMGEEELQEKFPDANVKEIASGSDSTDKTFEDRPRWVDSQEKRIRVAYHFWRESGVWKMCVFTQRAFLMEPQESVFLDDDGAPTCPIELVSAYIDRENMRYGVVRGFIDQQDEINHRRSKALHLLSQRQTYSRKGDIEDIAALKRELAKPDGHIEFVGEAWGKDFGVIPTSDMMRGQFELYQDAKNELDAVSFNAQLAGERQSGNLSGVAINRLQQAGVTELNRLFVVFNGWEKRVYRQIWSRIKQLWTAEKWIRVTDDQDTLRWVGLNTTMTAQEFLEEKVNDVSLPLPERQKAAAAYKTMMEAGDPRLQDVAGIKNPVPEIDVDIILDQSFDSVNAQQEQFQLLAQFAQGSKDIDILDLIEVSQLRGKKELIERIEKRRQQAAEAQGGAARLQADAAKAKIGETMAKAAVNQQQAIAQQIENSLMVEQAGSRVAAPQSEPQAF